MLEKKKKVFASESSRTEEKRFFILKVSGIMFWTIFSFKDLLYALNYFFPCFFNCFFGPHREKTYFFSFFSFFDLVLKEKCFFYFSRVNNNILSTFIHFSCSEALCGDVKKFSKKKWSTPWERTLPKKQCNVFAK